MTSLDIATYVPQIRPHNRLRDGKIYFMMSSRPTVDLSPEDVRLYQSIDGVKTVAELEKIQPGAYTRLVSWKQIVELIPPILAPSHPHLVVIEPHMDDAVLSAGGRLLLRRGRSRITILSVVKWSNFTSYLLRKRDFFDVQTVTALRQRESDLVARLLGAEHHSLDWSDGPIRFWPVERWSASTVETFTSAPQAFVKLFPSPAEVSLLAEQLTQALTRLAPDELWIPMGLGDHIDHRMTRSACLRMLADARIRLPGLAVSLYEDLPYAAMEGHAAQIRGALTNQGARLVRVTEDITDVFEEKLRVVSVYASQFKLSYMEPMLRKFAETEAGSAGKFSEAYYCLEGLRSVPYECLLSREPRRLEKLHNDAQLLTADRNKWRRVTIIILPSGQLGRWESIKASLSRAFPNADFKIYASDEVTWQMEGENRKFKLTVVRRTRVRWLGWLWALAREIPFRTPTIVLWRGAYASKPMQIFKSLVNMLIKFLLPFRRVLLARALWDFCCILDAQSDKSESEIHIADLEMA